MVMVCVSNLFNGIWLAQYRLWFYADCLRVNFLGWGS
jgi:hypothetical protein